VVLLFMPLLYFELDLLNTKGLEYQNANCAPLVGRALRQTENCWRQRGLRLAKRETTSVGVFSGDAIPASGQSTLPEA
jgi:hypothetical protein